MALVQLRRHFGVSHEVQQGTQGASRAAPGKSSLHLSCDGEHGISLKSWSGNQATRRDEDGLLRFFSGCGSKPWVPSTSAGSLNELFRVPIKSWGYCGVRRGLLGLHWVWCSGGGPHLELRQEPQSSSAFMTSIAGSLQRWNCRVRTHLALRNGTLLASRVVHGVTGHLSSCTWNLRVFLDDALGCHWPYVF